MSVQVIEQTPVEEPAEELEPQKNVSETQNLHGFHSKTVKFVVFVFLC